MNKNKILRIIMSILIMIIIAVLKVENNFFKVALYICAYIIIGYDIIKEAIENILKGDFFDENFLMSIATIGAIAIGEYPEAVAVMLFYQIGEIFEDAAVDKSKNSIESLMKIRPDYANVIGEDKSIQKMNPSEVKINSLIVVKPGEKIPLDGIVIDGSSTLDTSAITGESLPRDINIGENIYSGCVNLSGKLIIKVSKEFKESTVNKIIDLVQNASEKKTDTENFITKFSKVYTPIVVALAAIIAIFPPFIFHIGDFSTWLYKSLTFLVISCPCALVISVPLSFFGGIGGASKSGILIKGSNYLEILANLKTIVFDKTGTLTKGKFKVQEIIPNNVTREELLELVAYAESSSNHPIAKSIVETYTNTIDIEKISNIKEIAGKGVTCIINYNGEDSKIIVGNKLFITDEGITDISDEEKLIGTVLYAAKDNNYIGKIIIADELKEDSSKAIKELKKLGVVNTIMLTGDKTEVAESVANSIDIDTVFAELLPDEKLDRLEKILNTNYRTGGYLAFVGDGVNDAPSLARADVGIAMGGLGSDAAIEAADIVIMTDEPSKIAKAIKLAKKTIKIANENIWFAIGIKILILILSVMGIATMWEAVFADVGVTIIAILNSTRALRK